MGIALMLSATTTFAEAIQNKNPKEENSATLDFKAIRLQRLESERLRDHQGKVAIIKFWATYCGHCKRTNPLFAKAYISLF